MGGSCRVVEALFGECADVSSASMVLRLDVFEELGKPLVGEDLWAHGLLGI